MTGLCLAARATQAASAWPWLLLGLRAQVNCLKRKIVASFGSTPFFITESLILRWRSLGSLESKLVKQSN